MARHRTAPVLLLAAALLCGGTTAVIAAEIRAGAGRYFDAPRSALHARPRPATFVAADLVGQAVPTNQWYSSVVFLRWSQPLYAHPVSYQATPKGLELGRPPREIGTYEGSREVRELHRPALTVAPVAFQPEDARLSGRGDWHARVRLGDGQGKHLDATLLHGSPFSYYEVTDGDLSVSVAEGPAERLAGVDDTRALGLRVRGQAYVAYAPSGATWTEDSAGRWRVKFPDNRPRTLAIAALPNDSAATLRAFAAAAYVFPTDTTVDWRYDPATATVETVFRVHTRTLEGSAGTTLMGLYPHHWTARCAAATTSRDLAYTTLRGEIRVIPANEICISRKFHGVMPHWGGVEGTEGRRNVDSLLIGDRVKADELFKKMGRGTYWFGKGLGATAHLLSVAEAQGQDASAAELLDRLRKRFGSWFDGSRNTYFFHDKDTGTFSGLSQEYGSVTAMNDHHFHYGYWLMAAAHIALRDPAWASESAYGPLVDMFVKEIATADRSGRGFPFLRNFDPYESHSWASGDANFDAGNNQESSSESINAWAGLLLWGEATGNTAVRDLGIYLYTSEVAAIDAYWFDFDKQVLDPRFERPFASMVFGGKYSYNTWWTQEPRQILGINFLPVTTASTYLGRKPGALLPLVQRLPAEVRDYQRRGGQDGTLPDIWQDVIASALALDDVDAAIAMWRRNGTVEIGATRSQTQHWLLRLKEIGRPDFTVTADTPLYGVFRQADGTRTYMAWNARESAMQVRFSDGVTLDVPARRWAQRREPPPVN
jgi:endoglucanase Acf2